MDVKDTVADVTVEKFDLHPGQIVAIDHDDAYHRDAHCRRGTHWLLLSTSGSHDRVWIVMIL